MTAALARTRTPGRATPTTSTVCAVVLRVAGRPPTGTHLHAPGTPEQEVTVRIGDLLLYVRDAVTARRLRHGWAATGPLALRLPHRAIPERMPTVTGWPVTVALRLTHQVEVTPAWIPHTSGQALDVLRVRMDRLTWEVLDQRSWQTILDVLRDAEDRVAGIRRSSSHPHQ
ncbi:hypothetical protein [Streptoalloteichus hindustanus]|uniref:Uncharacterized protein n=1 Tax=Streptoalloteichus hindustanus TaxID=2017 RepID=A0A1M5MC62_STRHI|nr:hypothetical protein [Streptoalloteichus hindustanus]SHG74835.1 hypothetical protein SAMN05444320_11367 [Streptoalloteichus hindustanus]